ncbi:MFS transporter, partial [Rhizobium ruizarguesonis]
AMASFAAVPALQVGVVGFGKDSPNLVSTINIGSFNTGNALGSWVGGLVIDAGFDLTLVPLAAALMALIGLGATALTYHSAGARAARPLAER